MKVKIFSSDSIGGAARAAYRLHKAFTSSIEVDSSVIVRQKSNDDWLVSAPYEGRLSKVASFFYPYLDGLPLKLNRNSEGGPRSSGYVGIVSANSINRLNTDLINLHWICNGFLSIEEIGKIKKPIVWTLHDMWPFCGAEHLTRDTHNSRWQVGYTKHNRESSDRGFDLDRWVWERKIKSWKNPISIVTPSNWLAECARKSQIMHNWDVTVIPNALDVMKYKPIPKSLAREILGLPMDKKLILFGAIRGTQLSYKGWDLLEHALALVSRNLPEAQALILGQSEPKNPPKLGLKMHWLGHVYDDVSLALVYSASDVLVIPSRQENLPQVGTEAHSCGCPVVAFKTGGLTDVVEHGKTGFLAEPYSIEDLARGIEWVLDDMHRHKDLCINARNRAVNLWSHEVVVSQYIDLYRHVIENFNKAHH